MYTYTFRAFPCVYYKKNGVLTMTLNKNTLQIDYSVVIPVFNEELIIPELYQRLIDVMEKLCDVFELIFIDDGSTDKTFSLLESFAVSDERVIIIKLSRNFGQENAITAGLRCVQGQRVVLIDGDLQDPPEIIPELSLKMDEGYNVVMAIKAERQESRLIKYLTSGFYYSLKFFSNLNTPPQAGTFSIMDDKVVKALLLVPERNKYISGLRSFVGFKQAGIPYSRDIRTNGNGKSLYSLTRMALNAFFSFTSFPLRFLIFMGAAFILLSLCIMILMPFGIISITANSIFFQELLLFQFVIVMALLIFIAEYIVRMMDQVNKRPEYFIDQIINGNNE